MKLISIMFYVTCAVLIFTVDYSSAICIKAAKANMRSGPGKDYEIIWQAYRFMPFEIVGTSLSGDWYAVRDMDGDVGWIHKKPVTSKYRCAVVKSQIVNMRKGPGTKYAKVFSEPAQRYDSFRIIQRQGVWMKVKDEWNNVGWIHRDYLWVR
ncbi:MAG TPA: SH3 domain-containing protein [Thermodesulfovibrionales bacterium]|nr:SH3 domain-containing protein [Alphaproteobacteria bacterium]HZV47665.1 SH3 domain-containing protein [Thermodesulfovibrionales bacterium]